LDDTRKAVYNEEDEESKLVKIINSDYQGIPEERQDYFYIFKKYELHELIDFTFGRREGYMSKLILYIFYMLMISYITRFSSNSMTYSTFAFRNGYDKGKEVDNYELKTYYSYTIEVLYVVILLFISCIISEINQKYLVKIGYIIMIALSIPVLTCFIFFFLNVNLLKYTTINLIPLANFKNISSSLGFCLTSFSIQVYLPRYVEEFTPQKKLFRYILISGITAFLLISLFSILAVFTFSNIINCDIEDFPSALQLNILNNFQYFHKIAQISSFFQILNIVFIVYLIVSMKGIFFFGLYEKLKSTGKKIDRFKLVFLTMITCIIPVLICFFLEIFYIFNYFLPFFSCCICFYIPFSLLSKYNKKVKLYETHIGALNKSVFNKKIVNLIFGFIVFPFYVIFMIVNYSNIENKNCVSEFVFE
jgi:amino acid permease